MRYSKKTGMWYNGSGGGYIERDSCRKCGNPFLSRENGSDFCCIKCSRSGEYNGMYGKTHTEEVRNILKGNFKKAQKTIKEKYGVNNISQLEGIKKKKGQFIVNKENIRRELLEDDYELLGLSGSNKYADMKVKCYNGHIFSIKWTYYKAGHRCVECFYQRLRDNGIQDTSGFLLYKRLVEQETTKSYRKFKKIINPSNLERGRGMYHLDHKFSMAEGFKQDIDPKIIGSYINLEMLEESKNCSKAGSCSITKEELMNEYFREIRTV